jgi:hypothetical protein
LLYLLSPSSVHSSQTINGILRFLWSPIIKETLLDMAQQSSKVLEVPVSLVGNGNSFNDDATMLYEVLSNIHRCCSIRARSIKPKQVWSFVEVPMLNDESSFMLCSLANTWVEAPTLNTSETQRLHCFSTFPCRLGTNGLISEELETQRVSVMRLRPCPRVSSDNQPLAVRYRMTKDKFTHRFTHVHSSDIGSRIHYDTVPDDPVSISHLMAVRTWWKQRRLHKSPRDPKYLMTAIISCVQSCTSPSEDVVAVPDSGWETMVKQSVIPNRKTRCEERMDRSMESWLSATDISRDRHYHPSAYYRLCLHWRIASMSTYRRDIGTYIPFK